MTKYAVTVKHPCDEEQVKLVLMVHEDASFGFYATNALLGCGKTYKTEIAAISELVRDHAYSIRKIEKI